MKWKLYEKYKYINLSSIKLVVITQESAKIWQVGQRRKFGIKTGKNLSCTWKIRIFLTRSIVGFYGIVSQYLLLILSAIKITITNYTTSQVFLVLSNFVNYLQPCLVQYSKQTADSRPKILNFHIHLVMIIQRRVGDWKQRHRNEKLGR